MAIDAADFCLAILDRGTPLGINSLLNRSRKYKLGLQDYDIRRAIRVLRDQGLVKQSRSAFSSALIYTTTPEGEKRAKKHRLLVKLIFKHISKSKPTESKPSSTSTGPTPCLDCGSFEHRTLDCTLGRS